MYLCNVVSLEPSCSADWCLTSVEALVHYHGFLNPSICSVASPSFLDHFNCHGRRSHYGPCCRLR